MSTNPKVIIAGGAGISGLVPEPVAHGAAPMPPPYPVWPAQTQADPSLNSPPGQTREGQRPAAGPADAARHTDAAGPTRRGETYRCGGVTTRESRYKDEEGLVEFVTVLEFFVAIKGDQKYSIEASKGGSIERFCRDHNVAEFDKIDILPGLTRLGNNQNYSNNHVLIRPAITLAVEISTWMNSHQVRRMPRISTTHDLYPIQYIPLYSKVYFPDLVVKRFPEADLEWHVEGRATRSVFWDGAELNDTEWRETYLDKLEYKGAPVLEDGLRDIDEALRFVVRGFIVEDTECRWANRPRPVLIFGLQGRQTPMISTTTRGTREMWATYLRARGDLLLLNHDAAGVSPSTRARPVSRSATATQAAWAEILLAPAGL
ncbi:hypothetical protein B0J18DRAFT_462712 [Chaetomium sp. MPI-SDFR-AT-0129]|nr:hypothetical protein B0J18DRAFT_462712 [Chaetomium sp. MPI-SDFR-AT-0129]